MAATRLTRTTARIVAAGLLLAAAAALLYAALLPLVSTDMRVFLLPWFDEIRQRGFAAMAGEYANYAPSYLYLLGLASRLAGFADPVALIKSVSIAFTVLAAIVFAGIVRDVTGRPAFAALAGCAFPLLPTVAINAAWWGQCDVVYTLFLLCALRASLRRRALAVAVHFGLALSFKAQAIFLAPYLLALAWRRDIPWRHALVVPAVYAGMMLPAWVAGRDAADLALVYANQGSFFQSLSMNAPNPWTLVQRFALMAYPTGLALGCVAALLGTLALARRGTDAAFDAARAKLELATASALLVPYLLPKMHDRYFFPADVMLVLLACTDARYRRAAIAMQAGSLVVYVGYLLSDGHPRALYGEVGFLFATVALFETLRHLRATGEPHPRPAPATVALSGDTAR